MRHRKIKFKGNMTASHRKAMFRNMTTSLLEHERIKTTVPKAKAIRGLVDHVITLAKREDLHARRQVLAIVNDKKVVAKLFDKLASRYSDRQSGFTRIYKLGIRRGDCAPMAIIELVDAELAPVESKKE